MEVKKIDDGAKMERNSNHKEEEEGVNVLPGFRFHPTDEELVGFYLRRKVEKKLVSTIDQLIKQVDIYKYDPWDLPKVSNIVGDKEWYFFCMRGRKYKNSLRPNRVTGSGFWKATGIDKPIYSVNGGSHHICVGLKKSLVYYRGSAGKGTKTDWMMHEFRLPPANSKNNSTHTVSKSEEAEVWTLCRILKRSTSYRKYTQQAAIKQSFADSTSKTCSLESGNKISYLSFGDSAAAQKKNDEVSRQHAHQTNHFATHVDRHIPVAQSSFASSNSGDEFFGDVNWDELRSVVELAIDPSYYGHHACM